MKTCYWRSTKKETNIEGGGPDQSPSFTLAQAELLGVLHFRFAPLLGSERQTPTEDEAPNQTPASSPDADSNQKATLDFRIPADIENEQAFKPIDWEELTRLWRIPCDPVAFEDDHGLRMKLLAAGSIDIKKIRGTVPAIAKRPIGRFVRFKSLQKGWVIHRGLEKYLPLKLEIEIQKEDNPKLVLSGTPDSVQLYFSKEEPLSRFQNELRKQKDESESGKAICQVNLTPNSQIRPIEQVRYLFIRQIGEFEKQQFPLTIKLQGSEAKEITETVNVEFSDRHPYELTSEREVSPEEISQDLKPAAKLIPWSENPFGEQAEDNFPSLKLKTLPNIKSAFRFQIRNNTKSQRRLRAELYLVAREQQNEWKRLVPNRIDLYGENKSDFVTWLQSKPPLDNEPQLKLIARTDPFQLSEEDRSTPIDFQRPVRPDEPVNDDAAATTKPVEEVQQALLVVLYEQDSTSPNWYQFIEYQVDERVFNLRTDLKEPLLNWINIPKNELSSAVLEEFKKKQNPRLGAQFTIIQPREITIDTIDFKELIEGAPLAIQELDNAIGVVELLGIPNFEAIELKQNNTSYKAFRDNTFGIRILASGEKGKEIKTYPPNWSFISAIGTPRERSRWIAPIGGQQEIYVKGPAGDEQEMKIEFLLPEWPLTNSARDFALNVTPGVKPTLRYPTKRTAKVNLRADGTCEAWTEVSAHSYPISLAKLRERKEYKVELGGAAQADGTWIISAQGRSDPELKLNAPNNIVLEGNDPQALQKINFTLDLAEVRPRIDLSRPVDPENADQTGITVQLNEKSLGGSQLARLLRLETTAKYPPPELFRFSAYDLLSEFGVEIQEGKQEFNLIVNVHNFYETKKVGQKFTIERKPPQKPIATEQQAKKPKPTDVLLSIEMGEMQNAVVENLYIDGIEIPFREWFRMDANNPRIYAQRKTREKPYSIKLYGIRSGRSYAVRVVAKGRIPERGPAVREAEATIEIKPVLTKEDENKKIPRFKLSFEKPKNVENSGDTPSQHP